jgi:hypothetical protein
MAAGGGMGTAMPSLAEEPGRVAPRRAAAVGAARPAPKRRIEGDEAAPVVEVQAQGEPASVGGAAKGIASGE